MYFRKEGRALGEVTKVVHHVITYAYLEREYFPGWGGGEEDSKRLFLP